MAPNQKQQQGSSASGNKQNESVDVKKIENYSEWYFTKSDFLDYYEVGKPFGTIPQVNL